MIKRKKMDLNINDKMMRLAIQQNEDWNKKIIFSLTLTLS